MTFQDFFMIFHNFFMTFQSNYYTFSYGILCKLNSTYVDSEEVIIFS